MKSHVELYAYGAVLEGSEHGENGEVIDGNHGIRPALLSHPCSAEPWTNNDVHDAGVPVAQVILDARESHLGVASLDDGLVDVGQCISGRRIVIDAAPWD